MGFGFRLRCQNHVATLGNDLMMLDYCYVTTREIFEQSGFRPGNLKFDHYLNRFVRLSHGSVPLPKPKLPACHPVAGLALWVQGQKVSVWSRKMQHSLVARRCVIELVWNG